MIEILRRAMFSSRRNDVKKMPQVVLQNFLLIFSVNLIATYFDKAHYFHLGIIFATYFISVCAITESLMSCC